MESNGKTTRRFTVKDMECQSCEEIITRAALKDKGVHSITVDYATGKGEVTFDAKKTSLKRIMEEIEDKGYTCETKIKTRSSKKDGLIQKLKNVSIVLGILAILLGGYYILQDRLAFSMPALDQNTSLALLFIIGVLTGFHCIAMCGGFVVSYSTKTGNQAANFGPHLTYGLSKTVSYAFFGAVFGFIGSFFTFTPFMRGMAGVLAGIFLVLFGMNMLNLLTWFKRFRFKTPSIIDRFVSNRKENKSPLALGLLNGLMIACGPLQAMYVFAAASGSPYYGALYLAAFGLGTLPVLLGFGMLTSVLSSRFTHRIVRYSGVLVIILGLIMVNRGLALTGTGYDLNTVFISVQASEDVTANNSDTVIRLDSSGFQEIKMEVNRYGWNPDKFVLKKNVPVKWIIDGKEINGCNNAIQVPKLGLNFDVRKGIQTIEFTPTEEGVIPWSCWMGMIPGVFIVKDNIDVENPVEVQKELESVQVPRGGSCGGSCGSPTCGAARGGSCGCGGGR